MLVQQGGEDLPLVGHQVLGGVQGEGAVVGGQHRLNLPQNAGEDIITNVSGDNGHGAAATLVPLGQMGAAALTALNESLGGQQAQRLPHGLAADLELAAQSLLGGQKHGFIVLSRLDFPAQGVCDRLIFGAHNVPPSLVVLWDWSVGFVIESIPYLYIRCNTCSGYLF